MASFVTKQDASMPITDTMLNRANGFHKFSVMFVVMSMTKVQLVVKMSKLYIMAFDYTQYHIFKGHHFLLDNQSEV
jgi:hypothetical protein